MKLSSALDATGGNFSAIGFADNATRHIVRNHALKRIILLRNLFFQCGWKLGKYSPPALTVGAQVVLSERLEPFVESKLTCVPAAQGQVHSSKRWLHDDIQGAIFFHGIDNTDAKSSKSLPAQK